MQNSFFKLTDVMVSKNTIVIQFLFSLLFSSVFECIETEIQRRSVREAVQAATESILRQMKREVVGKLKESFDLEDVRKLSCIVYNVFSMHTGLKFELMNQHLYSKICSFALSFFKIFKIEFSIISSSKLQISGSVSAPNSGRIIFIVISYQMMHFLAKNETKLLCGSPPLYRVSGTDQDYKKPAETVYYKWKTSFARQK